MLRWILVLTLATYALGLGSTGLFESEETRYAQMAKEMAQTGDWLVPRLEGVPYLEKPPLTVWATALVFRALGVSEWTARIVPFLSVLLLVFFAYRIGRRIGDQAHALTACVILAGSPLLFGMGRILATDAPFAAAVLAAFDALLAIRERRTLARQLQLGIAVAASLLARGPLGPVLIAMGAASISWQDRSWSSLFESLRLVPLLVIVGAGAPWFWWIQQRYPAFLDFFLLHHHFARFLGTEPSNRDLHPASLYYYLPVVAGMAFPWIALTLAARKKMSLLPDPRMWRALWLWGVATFVFFSLGSGKRVPYLITALPPLALVLALAWQELRRRKALLVTAVSTAACFAAFALIFPRFDGKFSIRPIAAQAQKVSREETRQLVVYGEYYPGVSYYVGRGVPVFGSHGELGFGETLDPASLTIPWLDEPSFAKLLLRPGAVAILTSRRQSERKMEEWNRLMPFRILAESESWVLIAN